MSSLKPTEKKFEDHIEKNLNSYEYKSIDYGKYDRDLCLIKDEIINFIKIIYFKYIFFTFFNLLLR